MKSFQVANSTLATPTKLAKEAASVTSAAIPAADLELLLSGPATSQMIAGAIMKVIHAVPMGMNSIASAFFATELQLEPKAISMASTVISAADLE